MSIGSLYQYFPNKDAILFQLVCRHVNARVATIQAHLSGDLPDELDDLLRLFVRAALDIHRDNPRLHQVLFEEAPRPPELLALVADLERAVLLTAEQLLSAHREVGVDDVAVAARLVVVAIESLVHRYVAAGLPQGAARFEDELVAMLSRYLRG